jgi:hypothetical protein
MTPPRPSGTPPLRGEKILEVRVISLNRRELSPLLGEMSRSDRGVQLSKTESPLGGQGGRPVNLFLSYRNINQLNPVVFPQIPAVFFIF